MKHKKITVFVAGGKSLNQERDCVRVASAKLKNEFLNQGIDVNILIRSFEDFPRDHQYGTQSAYNKFIKNKADVCVFVFDGKVGGITKEELGVALEAHNSSKSGKPVVYGYAHKTSDDVVETIAVKELFCGITEQNAIQRYYVEYESLNDLENQIIEDLRYEIQKSPNIYVSTTFVAVASSVIALLICLLGVLYYMAMPVCREYADRFTMQQSSVHNLCEINNDIKNEVASFDKVLLTNDAKRIQSRETDMYDFLKLCKKNRDAAFNEYNQYRFKFSDWQYFLLTLFKQPKVELDAAENYAELMFDDMDNMLNWLKYSLDNSDYSEINQRYVNLLYQNFVSSYYVYYYGYAELLSHLPSSCIKTYNDLHRYWIYAPDVGLNLPSDEYTSRQEKELNRMEQNLTEQEALLRYIQGKLDDVLWNDTLIK